ncbi:MAG: CoA transferase [Deltaproteobacteria bacterium]|nr:CoA transferase [Deltaproteobacteria bacterium]MBW2447183.1 CoA transferase [Deltaproteobacteria bacterium]
MVYPGVAGRSPLWARLAHDGLEDVPLQIDRIQLLLEAARLEPPAVGDLAIHGSDPILASRFPIGEASAVALASCGAAAARLHELRGGEPQKVEVEVRAAAATLIGFLLQSGNLPIELRRAFNPVTAIHPAKDGRFIHLHGGFEHLAAGTLELLGCEADAGSIAAATEGWDGFELEDVLAERGLCGAVVRGAEEWAEHPQAIALAGRPVVEIERIGDAELEPTLAVPGRRPLSGVRVLDLTRVLAGPTCARTLAEHGADVLRVGAERLPSVEPFVVDTGRGKRNAFLDLDRPEELKRLRGLVSEADVLCQGYRPGALDARGLGAEAAAALRPGIVYVSIDCYGHVGPWSSRRGWEQLAQSAVGIAAAEGGDGPPRLAPAAATDYTTGALAAFGVMTALARRAREGGSWHVRASLCQTGMWLTRLGACHDPAAAVGLGDVTTLQMQSETAWGSLTHLAPAVKMAKTPPRFALPPSPLGSHAAEWLPRAPIGSAAS